MIITISLSSSLTANDDSRAYYSFFFFFLCTYTLDYRLSLASIEEPLFNWYAAECIVQHFFKQAADALRCSRSHLLD